jgi:hypothetical protein
MDAVQFMRDGNTFDPSSEKQWMFHWVMGGFTHHRPMIWTVTHGYDDQFEK